MKNPKWKKPRTIMRKESIIVVENTTSILERCVRKKDRIEITNHSITFSHKFRKMKLTTWMVFLLVYWEDKRRALYKGEERARNPWETLTAKARATAEQHMPWATLRAICGGPPWAMVVSMGSPWSSLLYHINWAKTQQPEMDPCSEGRAI